jgi:mono/diheme cytochrome c family protein
MRRRLAAACCGIVLCAGGMGASATEPTVSWSKFSAPAETAGSEIERGRAVFQNACAICHGAGPDRPGTISLQAKYQGSKPALLEDRTDLTPETVAYFVRNGVAMMPFFRPTELSDAQVKDVGAYLSRQRE